MNKSTKNRTALSSSEERYTPLGLKFNPFPRSGTTNINGSDFYNQKLLPVDEKVKKQITDFISHALKDNHINKEDKFISVVFDANQNPISLQATDFKASRMRGTETSNPKIINIPIIPELKETLVEMGLENFKGSHKYLLAPEENISRVTLKLHLSHMFKFYYDKLGTGEHRQYKHLRKFYISKLVSYIGLDNARLVTGHSGVEVMNHHYIDKRTIALSESTKNMTILGSQNDTRSEELKSIRKPSTEKSLER